MKLQRLSSHRALYQQLLKQQDKLVLTKLDVDSSDIRGGKALRDQLAELEARLPASKEWIVQPQTKAATIAQYRALGHLAQTKAQKIYERAQRGKPVVVAEAEGLVITEDGAVYRPKKTRARTGKYGRLKDSTMPTYGRRGRRVSRDEESEELRLVGHVVETRDHNFLIAYTRSGVRTFGTVEPKAPARNSVAKVSPKRVDITNIYKYSEGMSENESNISDNEIAGEFKRLFQDVTVLIEKHESKPPQYATKEQVADALARIRKIELPRIDND